MTIESNWSDRPEDEIIDETNRRYSALAMLLRARYLVDVDCWSEVRGQPIKPGTHLPRDPRQAADLEEKATNHDHAATECLLQMYDERHELEDYQSGVPRWCTGCGDNAILAAVQRLCRDEQLRPEKTVFVSGIGCSSRFPHYMKTYGFHGIHGRALPIAEGVKMARPDLHVFVNTGDGDCCSIGAAHWIHAIRYNMNLTVFLHDNQIYGLTKKQASPTSPIGHQEQHHAARQLPRGAAIRSRSRSACRTCRSSRRRSTGSRRCSTTSSRRPTTTRASRSCASSSAARSGCRSCSSRGCTTRSRMQLLHHEHGLQLSAEPRQGLQEPAASTTRRTSTARARSRRHRSDPGRHPVPQSGGALLRGPARTRGSCARPSSSRTGLEAEFDKFTVWPQGTNGAATGSTRTPAQQHHRDTTWKPNFRRTSPFT